MPRIAIPLAFLISGFCLSSCDGAAHRQPPSEPTAAPATPSMPAPIVPTIPAQAQCDAPPYGDTQENYAKFSSSMHITGADPTVAKMLQFVSQEAISKACKIKFENADRAEYHTWGISDDDIAVTSTSGLAVQDINYHTQRLAKSEPVKNPYQTISVRNFVIDGPQLAAAHAKVDLVGVYILQGSLGMLYTDTQAVVMAKYNSEISTQPSVALLTDDASHKLREDLLSCSSNSGAQLGCKVEIRGEATICTLTNNFGASREAPCINGEDGGYWSPPPPTPAELEQQREAKEAAEAAQRQATALNAERTAEYAAKQRRAVEWAYQRNKAACLQRMNAHRLPGQDDPELLCDRGARTNADGNPIMDVAQYCTYIQSTGASCDTPVAESQTDTAPASHSPPPAAVHDPAPIKVASIARAEEVAPAPPPAQPSREQPTTRTHGEPFAIHGAERRCIDITQLDRALSTSYGAYFNGWVRADYDEAIAWSTECTRYGWQSVASSRVSLLQAREASTLTR